MSVARGINLVNEARAKGVAFALSRRGLGRVSALTLANWALNSAEIKARRIRLLSNPEYVQVEPTTACNLDCAMCGRRTAWSSLRSTPAFMTRETFCRVIPFLRTARRVFLHGWGEPLLHPEITWMAGVCRSERCLVDITTNGLLLTRELIKELVRLELDTLSISLEGATQQTYGEIRRASFDALVENIEELARVKRDAKKERPIVQFIYCLMSKNLGELPKLVDVAHQCGVDGIWINNLIVYHHEMAEQSLFGRESEVDAICKAAREKAERLQILLRYRGLRPTRAYPDCAYRNLAILCDGSVGCCGAQRVILGDVHSSSLRELWNGPNYQELRAQYASGDLPEACRRCPNLTNLRRDYEEPDLGYVEETLSMRRWDRTRLETVFTRPHDAPLR